MQGVNAILSKFSLTVLIRQFFCGVVFFLPYLMLNGESTAFSFTKGLGESGTLGLCVTLACIMGTIIHHLEKNVYSYVIQMLLCCFHNDKSSGDRGCCGCMMLFIALSIAFLVMVTFHNVFLFYCLLSLVIIIVALWNWKGRCLVAETQALWKISGEGKYIQKHKNEAICKDNRDRLYKFSILERLDAWSDNIHCAQCCCFSWILGYYFAKLVAPEKQEILFVQCDDGNQVFKCFSFFDFEIVNQTFWNASISLALFVLVLEFLFEWHRHYHIASILQDSNSSQTKK